MAQLAAVGVIVADLERSAAFYRKLGLDFPDPIDPEGHGHAEAVGPGGLRVMLDTIDTIGSFDPNWTKPSGGHRIGLAFECNSAADVDATYAKLIGEAAKSYKEPWDAFWGQRYAQINDPDGNVVDLFAAL